MKVDRAYIDAGVPPATFHGSAEDGYDNAARYACKCILENAALDPVGFKAAMDAFRADPFSNAMDRFLTPAQNDELDGMTGFMWGWAVQTAAYLTEQEPVGNPAVWSFG